MKTSSVDRLRIPALGVWTLLLQPDPDRSDRFLYARDLASVVPHLSLRKAASMVNEATVQGRWVSAFSGTSIEVQRCGLWLVKRGWRVVMESNFNEWEEPDNISAVGAMTDDEKVEILCDAVHGTMRHAYFLAQKEGVSPELWQEILSGAKAAMDIAYQDGLSTRMVGPA